jgi:hypothetical protein
MRIVLAAGAVAGIIGIGIGAAGIATAATTPTPTTKPPASAPANGNCPNMGGASNSAASANT